MRYRVLRLTTVGFSEPTTTTGVLWEGTELGELSKRFPKSNVADTLGHREIEDGWVCFNHHFEQRVEGEEWQQIEDPRHKIYDRRQAMLDAAIDAENRRCYPGDYLDDDEDYDYYDEDDD